MEKTDKKPLDPLDEEASIEVEAIEDCNRCNISQMTLDEAIQHCRAVASKTGECRCADEHSQLAAWLEELKSLKSKYVYLAADFDNYKKRCERDKSEALKSASRDLALDIFPVVSTFEIALKSIESHEVERNGMQMVLDNLVEALHHHGFQKIGVKAGDYFDVSTCEAISSRDCGLDPDTISDVYSDGWMQDGKVILPAKVVVAK